MIKLKVLNLYAGIGGNRKLWKDVEVTAVELDPDIAKIYQSYFPDDKVVVGDAHQYLLDHYKEFDFIWTSPPCPTHSRARFWGLGNGTVKPVYPDMKLYQEIIFLKFHFKGMYCVENVIPYYNTPLIPAKKLGRHLFWTSFKVGEYEINENRELHKIKIKEFGYVENYKGKQRKDKIIRNTVNHDLGLYILNCARNIITKSNINQLDFFEINDTNRK